MLLIQFLEISLSKREIASVSQTNRTCFQFLGYQFQITKRIIHLSLPTLQSTARSPYALCRLLICLHSPLKLIQVRIMFAFAIEFDPSRIYMFAFIIEIDPSRIYMFAFIIEIDPSRIYMFAFVIEVDPRKNFLVLTNYNMGISELGTNSQKLMINLCQT